MGSIGTKGLFSFIVLVALFCCISCEKDNSPSHPASDYGIIDPSVGALVLTDTSDLSGGFPNWGGRVFHRVNGKLDFNTIIDFSLNPGQRRILSLAPGSYQITGSVESLPVNGAIWLFHLDAIDIDIQAGEAVVLSYQNTSVDRQ